MTLTLSRDQIQARGSQRPGHKRRPNTTNHFILFCYIYCLNFIICLTYCLYFTIFNSKTTQLAIPNKKTRFGPKVASRNWWIDRIKIAQPKYTSYWTHYTKYQIGQFKALAKLDYQVLGERVSTEGAPDSCLARKYPIKLAGKPFWLTWDYRTFKDFKLWTWLQATKALDLPISEQAEIWFNYFSIESN